MRKKPQQEPCTSGTEAAIVVHLQRLELDHILARLAAVEAELESGRFGDAT